MVNNANRPILSAIERIALLPDSQATVDSTISAWKEIEDIIKSSNPPPYRRDPMMNTRERERSIEEDILAKSEGAGEDRDSAASEEALNKALAEDSESLAAYLYEEFSKEFGTSEASYTNTQRAKSFNAAATMILARSSPESELSFDNAPKANNALALLKNTKESGLDQDSSALKLLTVQTPLTAVEVKNVSIPSRKEQAENKAKALRAKAEKAKAVTTEFMAFVRSNALSDTDRAKAASLYKNKAVADAIAFMQKRGDLTEDDIAKIGFITATGEPAKDANGNIKERRGSVSNSETIEGDGVVSPAEGGAVSDPASDNLSVNEKASRILELTAKQVSFNQLKGGHGGQFSDQERREYEQLCADQHALNIAAKISRDKDPAVAAHLEYVKTLMKNGPDNLQKSGAGQEAAQGAAQSQTPIYDPVNRLLELARKQALSLQKKGDPLSKEEADEFDRLCADQRVFDIAAAQNKDARINEIFEAVKNFAASHARRQGTSENPLLAEHRRRVGNSASQAGLDSEKAQQQAQRQMMQQQMQQQPMQPQAKERVGFFKALNECLGGMVARMGRPASPEEAAARRNLAFSVAAEATAKAFDSFEEADGNLKMSISASKEAVSSIKEAHSQREGHIEGLANIAEQYYPNVGRAEAIATLYHAANLAPLSPEQRKEADPEGKMTNAADDFLKLPPEQQSEIRKGFQTCQNLAEQEESARAKLTDARQRLPNLLAAKTAAINALNKHGNLDRNMAETLKRDADDDVESINEMENEVAQNDAAKMKPEDEEKHRNAMVKAMREMIEAIKKVLLRVVRMFTGPAEAAKAERTAEPSP